MGNDAVVARLSDAMTTAGIPVDLKIADLDRLLNMACFEGRIVGDNGIDRDDGALQ